MENPLPEDSVPENEDFNNPEPDLPKSRPEFSVSNSIQTIISIGLVMATLLTLWNPRKVFNTSSLTVLLKSEATQAAKDAQSEENTNLRIGILAGHWENSPGEVCSDGIIESDVNHDIALRVVQLLENQGYQIDLFPEYDLEFLNYEGTAFISLYSGSCAENPPPASGFKIGASYLAQNPDEIDRLATCISQEYQNAVNLPFTYEVIDSEHASHHIFRDIAANTPAVRLEMGSLKTDRRILINQADDAAQGIAAGILCFLNIE